MKATHVLMRKVIVDAGNGAERTDDTRVPIAAVEDYVRKGYVVVAGDAGRNAHGLSKEQLK